MTTPLPWAWGVQTGDLRAVFLEYSKAVSYATHTHGVLVPLMTMWPDSTLDKRTA